MRIANRVAAVLFMLLAVPAATFAQQLGTIAGAVRDTSGAVLPGVTVEVASPALIEKVRTAVADGSGQYTVINLPVGTYSVTFTLPGFNTVRRERHRASRELHRHHQRGAERRRPRRDDHRLRRIADRRPPERGRGAVGHAGSHSRHPERRHDVSAGADDGRRRHYQHAGRGRHCRLAQGEPARVARWTGGRRAAARRRPSRRQQHGAGWRVGTISRRCSSTRSTSRSRARRERPPPTASSATACPDQVATCSAAPSTRQRVRAELQSDNPNQRLIRHGPAERTAHQGAL